MVSDHGEVWKITKNGLKRTLGTKAGADYTIISINGKREYLHRVIIGAFNGGSELEVDHLDMNKSNNILSNLEYVTHEENMKRAWKSGKVSQASKMKKVKHNNVTYDSITEMCKVLGLTIGAASDALKKGNKIKGYYAERVEV